MNWKKRREKEELIYKEINKIIDRETSLNKLWYLKGLDDQEPCVLINDRFMLEVNISNSTWFDDLKPLFKKDEVQFYVCLWQRSSLKERWGPGNEDAFGEATLHFVCTPGEAVKHLERIVHDFKDVTDREEMISCLCEYNKKYGMYLWEEEKAKSGKS